MSIILFLDIIGTIAFAISGVIMALNKRFDPFGIFIIAFVTAVGGGTLRDVLIKWPVAWMEDLVYIFVIAATTVFSVIYRRKLNLIRKSLFFFDSIGIALYTVVGVERGIAAGFHPVICIALGTITACFGGITRDILCNEIPLIFRKEIYATACIAGASAYFLFLATGMSTGLVAVFAGLVVMIIRLLAVYFDLSLPGIYGRDESD